MTILKKDVAIGAFYAIKHTSSQSGKLTIIKIERESPYGGWDATNLKTGRKIRIKSNTKLRARVVKSTDGKWKVYATT